MRLWARVDHAVLSDARVAWTLIYEKVVLAEQVRWQFVNGPIAALIAMLHPFGWRLTHMEFWDTPPWVSCSLHICGQSQGIAGLAGA